MVEYLLILCRRYCWRLKVKKVLLGLLFIAVSLFCINGNTFHVKAASERAYVQKVLKKYHAKGTVVIIKDGEAEQISSGYGYYSRKIKNGSDKLVYPLGSLQKVVTGAIITQLIYQNKFTQNTKISCWYPHLKNAKNITVGQLMTHTSGINMSSTESSHGVLFSEEGAINWTVLRDNLQSHTSLGKFNYNNANYVLLAGIIRKVTGKSYASNVKSRIIKPLKLKHTYVYTQIPRNKTDAISYLYSSGRNYQNSAYVNKYVVSQLPGAGDLFSNPSDYRKIIAGLSNGKILNQDQFEYLTHLKSKDSTYSGGMYLKDKGRLQLAYGNFGDTHFSNWMQITSDNQNGIVIFLNQTESSSKPAKKVGYQILKHLKKNTFIRG